METSGAARSRRWRETHPEYKRARNDKGRKRSGKKKTLSMMERPFLAIDGEGVTRDDNQHDYTLLAASDGSSIEQWNRDGIATARCFDYLIDLHERNPRAIFIGFSIGYDVNMMLRDVTRSQLERIAASEYTIVQNRYIVRYVPGKSFYVGRGHNRADNTWETEVGVTWWDTWGFFQSSFVNALKEWKIGSAETIQIIASMKDARSDFDDEMRETVKAYCFRECDLLVDLMGAFRDVLNAAGIRLSRWDGAGAVAGALLQANKVKQYKVEPPPEVQRAAMYAYFGGRIEIYGSGVVKEPCYEYDINSAYPAEIAELPSLHGEWQHQFPTDITPIRASSIGLYPWALWRVKWSTPDRPNQSIVGPFPWRDAHGSVIYTANGEGWYHGVEVQAVIEAMPHVKLEILEGYVFASHSQRKPFAWVRDMYAKRQAYKAAGDARHIVIKLGLNAGYGKLAQTVGMSGQPPYQSFYWAGRVTAGTRAKMIRALALVPQTEAISCMTDALFTRNPLPLPLSKELGEWSETVIDAALLVVQAGVVLTPEKPCATCNGDGCAWCKGTGKAMFFGRSRGFYRASLDYNQARTAWDSGGGFLASWEITETRFIGMGRALAAQRFIEWTLPDDPPKDVFGNLISTLWRRWATCAKRIGFRANMDKKRYLENGFVRRNYPAFYYPDGRQCWVPWLMYASSGEMSGEYTRVSVEATRRAISDIDMLEQVDAVRGNTL